MSPRRSPSSPRYQREVDTEPFVAIVAEALAAYTVDFRYAEQMAARAAVIAHKRQSWEVRIELREAEAIAVAACSAAGSVTCDVTEPCGTGRCRYAPPELAELRVSPTRPRSGTWHERPQPGHPDPVYNLESVHGALMQLRRPSPTP